VDRVDGATQPVGVNMSDPSVVSVAERAAYREGQRAGLAVAALAVAIVAFLQLLGVEKSLLAVVLGALSLRGAATRGPLRSWGRAAIIVGIVHVVLVIVLLIVFHDTFVQLLHLLRKFG
jgi:hypothetical protein